MRKQRHNKVQGEIDVAIKCMKRFRKNMKLLAWLGLLSMHLCMPGMAQESQRPLHHADEGFRNYPIIEDPPSLGVDFYWKRFTSSFSHPEVPDSHVLPEDEAINLYQTLRDEDTITWIGQSTLLIKIDGVTILTDPYFSELASPLIVGPSRYVDPGISAESLPPIDIILVSHNHYDHLDEDFVEAIPNKEKIQVFVPFKLGGFFSERGFTNIQELDWYQAGESGNIQFTAQPMVHYSGRGLGDKNKTLWCSWAINAPSGKLFFLGDSAYSPTLFKEIGEKYSSFDLAMLTIGTYGNRKYGINNHATPEEAVAIGLEVNARTLLGIHWGTIDLSDEDPWEPPGRFRKSAKEAGYSTDNVWLMKIGETRRLPVRMPKP